MTTRPIYEIANDIGRNWKNVYFGARPYLEAMCTRSQSEVTVTNKPTGIKDIVEALDNQKPELAVELAEIVAARTFSDVDEILEIAIDTHTGSTTRSRSSCTSRRTPPHSGEMTPDGSRRSSSHS